MEQAILHIQQKSGGRYEVELYFRDGRERKALKELKVTDTALHQTAVLVERKMGIVVRVTATAGSVLYENAQFAALMNSPATPTQPAPTQSEAPLSLAHTDQVREPALAPYNFVPLNACVVRAEERPDFNQYDPTRLTGWIELDIETKTPLYIRGTLSEPDVKKGKKAKDTPCFFGPGGELRIPGSSLRGMLRNMVEIVSFGKFEFFTDRRLYFRGLADKSNLRQEYQEHMTSYDRKGKKANYTMSAGILRKVPGAFRSYEILPAPGFRQIFKKEARNRIGRAYRDEFACYRLGNEYLVVSGMMKNKKRDWLIQMPAPDANPIPVPDADVQDYLGDATRSDQVPNLIACLEDDKKHAQYLIGGAEDTGRVPCFYTIWTDQDDKQRVSFGHTAMFRLAYEYTIGDHIPDDLKDPNITDLAGAIFGNEHTFAGRVFVEDASLQTTGQTDVLMDGGKPKYPKILSTPKPTTFQQYLVQPKDDIRQLSYYNSATAIRGHKLYWHKSGNDWQEVPGVAEAAIKKARDAKKESQYTEISPVRPGILFSGRIRFENLSSVEVGALLFSLDLPSGCRHKLGMGKPLGLGSVRITPRLHLSTRTAKQEDTSAPDPKQPTRYTDLLLEWTSEPPQMSEDECKGYKAQFERYVLDQLGDTKHRSLWEIDRLQELETLLNYQKGLERQQVTSYMQITPQNEFKNRNILPKPSKIGPQKK